MNKVLPIKYIFFAVLLCIFIYCLSWILLKFFDVAGVTVISLFIGMICGFKLAIWEKKQ